MCQSLNYTRKYKVLSTPCSTYPATTLFHVHFQLGPGLGSPVLGEEVEGIAVIYFVWQFVSKMQMTVCPCQLAPGLNPGDCWFSCLMHDPPSNNPLDGSCVGDALTVCLFPTPIWSEPKLAGFNTMLNPSSSCFCKCL